MGLKISFLVGGLSLLLPSLALPAAVDLNGTCLAGSCASPDTLNSGGSTGGNIGLTYTFSNGDQYAVSGSYGANYSNASVNIFGNPVVTYLGNTTNASAPSQADVLTFNFLQNFNYTDGSADGYYSYYFISNTTGPIAGSSTYTGDLAFDGQHIGATTVGTGFSGTNGFNQADLTGLATDPLTADLILTLAFGAGSGVGATIATVTPEPSSILLLVCGGVGLFSMALTNRSRKATAEAKS